MDEKAEGRITFTYQNFLSKGTSGLVAPGLISIPSLDATLRMHREYESRVTQEVGEFSDERNVSVFVNWGGWLEEMSHDVLVAQAITAEIGKGLDLLGITWRKGEADTDSGSGSNVDRLAELPLDESENQLVEQARELARYFSTLRDDWILDEHHLFATRYSEALGLSDVTLDEWYLAYPELPLVKGLRDWMDVSDEMEAEGYVLDGTALIEDCTTVLERVVDLIIRYGPKRPSARCQTD